MADPRMTSRSFAGTIRRDLVRPYSPVMRTLDHVRGLGERTRDMLLAAVAFAFAQAEVWLVLQTDHRAETALAAAAMTAALAWRRRRPLATVVVVLLAVLGLSLVLPTGLPNAVFLLPTGLVAMYSLGGYASLDRALVGLAASMVALPLTAVRIEDATFTDLSAPVFLFAAAWGTGRVLRLRRLRDQDLTERNEKMVREQAEREAQATADERRRIARELHDIVAHRVTTMVIQAESGNAAAEDPEQARRAFGVDCGLRPRSSRRVASAAGPAAGRWRAFDKARARRGPDR